MVQAYVLIQTEVGKSSSVAQSIRDIKGVVATDEVTGPYDIIAKLEAVSVEELGSLVLAKVQEVSGITRTLTCTVVHA
ncbi:Lrp/AsnC ligand binding domain-containing protein [Mobilicoccus sp.]|uniref:Lrp/AsnC ligand binding domain-containing protein n=1 Tax=Mobilicoccus sp. TaxID=2034349 RepID=UPI0028988F83|nr:Lrp/AsnC ligand binding domain-containing protein [Mobilicoccus sp.]